MSPTRALPAGSAAVRVLAACLLAVCGTALVASPAAAHGADAPDGTNYRTAITGISPALDGLTVRAVEAGGRLELVNRSGHTIEVLGYQGEPYLEVRPDGVYSNIRSPAAYLNATLTGDSAVPASADPALAPEWRKLSDEPVVRWHDHRTHWMSAADPPQVNADRGHSHRIRDWVVPLRDNLSMIEVNGTLDWLPPPAAAPWWGGIVVVALLIGALGLLWDRLTPVLAGLAAVTGLAAIGYAVSRELDAGAVTVGEVLLGLLRGQIWAVLVGLAGLAAAGYTLRRRAAADLALGLAGACLALIAGATNAAVFGRSVVPVPWDPVLARLGTAIAIGVGAGLALAAGIRLRAVSVAAMRSAQARPGASSTQAPDTEPATDAPPAQPPGSPAQPPPGPAAAQP